MSQLPPLEDLRVFATAARVEGFSAAAMQLNCSPAYISKRVALLEKTLGVKLFIRSARHVRLTLEGKIALEWAEKLLGTMEEMLAEIHREHQLPRGKLRIVTSTGFGSQQIAPVISQLSRQYTELEFDLELLDRPVDLISEGFDLELRVGGTLPQQMIAKRLCKNHRVLCASPAYLSQHGRPDELTQLQQHRCIGIRERDQNFGQWHLQNESGQKSITLNAPLTTNNGSVAKQWCLDGQGIMLRSLWNVQAELDSGQLIRVLPDYCQPADVYAIYPFRLETSAKLRVVVNLLEEQLNHSH